MLKRLTINQKLFIPSILVMIYFIAMFALQWQMRHTHERLDQLSQQYSQLDTAADEVTESLLKTVVISQRFELTHQLEDIEAYNLLAKKIDAFFVTAGESLPIQEEQRNLLQQTRLQWVSTREQFHMMVEKQTELGLDENHGLLGALRTAVHEVEAELDRHQEITLAHSMLMMRRHEKDFLARKHDQYVLEMTEERKRFAKLLQASKLDAATRQTISKKITFYYNSFRQLVTGVHAVDAAAKLVHQKSDAALKNVSDLQAGIHRMLEENRAVQEQTSQEQARLFLWFMVVMGVLLLLLLVLLAFHLTKPLQLLIDRMRAVVEGDGDLSRRLDEQGRDETATLAHLINRMLDNLVHLIQRVQRAGIQVASSAKQLSASIKEQEASTTEYAATANQVAASIREITSTSRDLSYALNETNQLVQQTDELAGSSQGRLENMNASMNRMAGSSQSITNHLAEMSEKAGSINSMVTTINKIADQTNLLSLNAAIEAEKAGEYGRGFAVVASEIRRLADQTAVATYDIEQMVKEVQSTVASGVMSMDRFTEELHHSVEDARVASEEMRKVINMVRAFAPHMESINEGLNTQNQEAEEISDAMLNLSEAAQQTADLVSQSNRSIHDLDEAVSSLQNAVSLFVVKKAL